MPKRKFFLLLYSLVILSLITFLSGCYRFRGSIAQGYNILSSIELDFENGDNSKNVTKPFKLVRHDDEDLSNLDLLIELSNDILKYNKESFTFVITKPLDKDRECQISIILKVDNEAIVRKSKVIIKKTYTPTPVPPTPTPQDNKLCYVFSLNGGKLNNTTESIISFVNKNEKINEPGIPVKDGYNFIGWHYKDKLVSFPFIVTKHTVIEAKYEKNGSPAPTPQDDKFCYSFNLNGGVINSSEIIPPKFADKNEAINPPAEDPQKQGHKFTGWFLDNVKVVFPYTVTRHITFEAKYEQVSPTPIPNPDEDEDISMHHSEGNDIPGDYYKSALNKKGEELVLALQNILKNMIQRTYADNRHDAEKTDENPDNPGKLYEIYQVKNYNNHWDGGKTWNREHVWPCSKLGEKGLPGTDNKGRPKPGFKGRASDTHNLRACDKDVNSKRQDYYFFQETNQNPENGYTLSGEKKFFPGKAHKGDAARIIMYMAVRYYGILRLKKEPKDSPKYELDGAEMGDVSLLYKWHREDPVDKFEISRNKKIYKIQKNRNPFIDRPELFRKCWKFFMQKENLTITYTSCISTGRKFLKNNIKNCIKVNFLSEIKDDMTS